MTMIEGVQSKDSFFLREIYSFYYGETVSSVGRATDFGLEVVGSSPILVLQNLESDKGSYIL